MYFGKYVFLLGDETEIRRLRRTDELTREALRQKERENEDLQGELTAPGMSGSDSKHK